MGGGAGKLRGKSYAVHKQPGGAVRHDGSTKSASSDSEVSMGSTSPRVASQPLPQQTDKLKKRGMSGRFLSIWRPEKEFREFKLHVDFLRAIASPGTHLDTYCHVIISEVKQVLQADRCSIYFVDEVRKEVWCIGASDCEPFRMPWDRGIVGLAARDGKTLNISDPPSHSAFDKTVQQKTGYVVNNMLTLPIRHMVDQSRAVGVIQVLNKLGEPGGFSQQDEMELEKFSMIISDSFYRQRWRALESSAKLEQESLALLATVNVEAPTKAQSRPATAVSSSGTLNPTMPFVWRQEEEPPPEPLFKSCADPDGNVPSPMHEEDLQPPIPETREVVVGFSSQSSTPPEVARSFIFDTLSYTKDELVLMVPMMLEDINVVKTCGIMADRLRGWVFAVQRSYRNNSFHNWFHGFSVFQNCFSQLYACKMVGLRFVDIFAVLVAALCHDLDHPGVSNSYLVEGEDELALRYNDQSVLENHHAFLACEILRKEETAIGACMPKSEQSCLRRTVVRSILDTDMLRHNDLCQQTVSRLGSANKEDATPADRQFCLSMLLHTADLSAQLQPFSCAAAWEERVSQEFVLQAELEIEAGRTPAPFMTFDMGDIQQRGKLQRNFIDYVLVPMWDPYTQLRPFLRPAFARLLANRAKYDYRSIHGCDAPPEVHNVNEASSGSAPDRGRSL